MLAPFGGGPTLYTRPTKLAPGSRLLWPLHTCAIRCYIQHSALSTDVELRNTNNGGNGFALLIHNFYPHYTQAQESQRTLPAAQLLRH
jgi:hypothetical protein